MNDNDRSHRLRPFLRLFSRTKSLKESGYEATSLSPFTTNFLLTQRNTNKSLIDRLAITFSQATSFALT
jgi:hypothetical protein